MRTDYINKGARKKTVLCTVVAMVLLCAVFFSMVNILFRDAEEAAYENLHLQTKQIKDDIHLQVISDRENLVTMANFAARLYKGGEGYDLLFNSFKPIGLIANIGILNPDNTFLTKTGTADLAGKISFTEEVGRGEYISGRVVDLTNEDNELVRSAVPIKVDGDVVGVLYGVLRLESITARYDKLAEELDAQLFIYDKATGDLIVDTVHDELGNISFLKDRQYNDGYSYEQMASTENGFTSFQSVYKDENAYLHYSTIEDLGWMIALVRYDSQVFAETHALTRMLLVVFAVMVVIMALLLTVLLRSEKQMGAVAVCASEVRKTLLEAAGDQDHITEALKQICLFSDSRSAIFFDVNGGGYSYFVPGHRKTLISEADRNFFMSELLRYIAEIYTQSGTAINVNCIRPNDRLAQTNPAFHQLLNEFEITDIVFSATINSSNHVTILSMINSRHRKAAEMIVEKISACFSMALHNKTNLSMTRLAATTDSLTGALNRVAYKHDLAQLNEEKPLDFACIYVDVNELHLRNNRYGHAAGDEMLLYIANSLKEVFFGHKVYRLGGDEFLVFCRNSGQEEVKKGIEIFLEQLKPRGYHVAVGLSYRSQNTDTEEMVKEAEGRMYEAKAAYYQGKENEGSPELQEREFLLAKTGILEVDTMLSILRENYNGIYRVSLDTDRARRVLMPAYLQYNEEEDHFSALFSDYVSKLARPDFHRGLLNFCNYDVLKRQMAEGKIPRITYEKTNGEAVVLSVYKLGDSVSETLWIFAKK